MDGPAHHVHLLGGRACKRDALVHHVFGTYTGELVALEPFEVLGGIRWVDPGPCALRLWQVGSDATEIIRSTDAPVGPVDGQAFSQFGGSVAGGIRTQNVSIAKLQVTMQNYGGEHRFFMDANQQIEVYSDKISFDLVFPRNFTIVTPSNRDSLESERPGLVSDTKIGAYYFEIEESRAKNWCRYTTYHAVPAETHVSIQIPPFASDLTVYQTSAGAASTAWTAWIGDPAAPGIEVASLPFIAGARKTEPLMVLPSATHLQTDVDANTARFFTIHWTIRP